MAYLGEIRLFAFDWAPQYWMPCEGQLIPIAMNRALFALIGTVYGGDGIRNFALPDLRGVVTTGVPGSSPGVGQYIGTETVTLTLSNLPSHTHTLVTPRNEAPKASAAAGDTATPAANNNTLGTLNDPSASQLNAFYNSDQPNVQLNIGQPSVITLGNSGGTQPVSVMQPYLPIGFYMCVQNGTYPSPG